METQRGESDRSEWSPCRKGLSSFCWVWRYITWNSGQSRCVYFQLATSKGCIAGDLKYMETDGNAVDCSQTSSVSRCSGITIWGSSSPFLASSNPYKNITWKIHISGHFSSIPCWRSTWCVFIECAFTVFTDNLLCQKNRRRNQSWEF